jgi:hypothetical protein
MPIPRVRFTLLLLMALVAIVAATMGIGLVLWRRSEEFRTLAKFHTRRANERVTPIGPAAQGLVLSRKAYHSAMARKYDLAARYPFLPVGPDPATPPGVESGPPRGPYQAGGAPVQAGALPSPLPFLPVAPDPPEPE